MGQSRPHFRLFLYFPHSNIKLQFQFQFQIERSVDGALGIQTRGRRMAGIDENRQLWRPPTLPNILFSVSRKQKQIIVAAKWFAKLRLCSVTKFGVFGHKFPIKSSLNIGLFCKRSFCYKLLRLLFRHDLIIIGLFFIPTSGHTAAGMVAIDWLTTVWF